jgi:hypothetical protein
MRKKERDWGIFLIPYETGPLALCYFCVYCEPRANALGWYEVAPLALSISNDHANERNR